MELMIMPRAGGKTSTLIEMAIKDPDIVIVCLMQTEADHIYRSAIGHGEKISKPVTYSHLMKVPYLYRDAKLVFDNLDLFLRDLFPSECVAATITDKRHLTIKLGE